MQLQYKRCTDFQAGLIVHTFALFHRRATLAALNASHKLLGSQIEGAHPKAREFAGLVSSREGLSMCHCGPWHTCQAKVSKSETGLCRERPQSAEHFVQACQIRSPSNGWHLISADLEASQGESPT